SPADAAPPVNHLSYDATATAAIYNLSLHDALPICKSRRRIVRDVIRIAGSRIRPRIEIRFRRCIRCLCIDDQCFVAAQRPGGTRSEEHTSELQSRENLVCRLLLEKKQSTELRTGTA